MDHYLYLYIDYLNKKNTIQYKAWFLTYPESKNVWIALMLESTNYWPGYLIVLRTWIYYYINGLAV